MSASTVTITVYPHPKGVTNDQRTQTLRGTFTISAGSYPKGGLPLDWTTIEQVKSIPFGSSTPTSTSTPFPIDVDVKSVGNVNTTAGKGPSGVVYGWDNDSGNLHVFISNNGVSAVSGPLIEIGSGALPGWIINDTIQFTAVFARE